MKRHDFESEESIESSEKLLDGWSKSHSLVSSYRLKVCLLTSFAIALTYASRVALSVSIVAMTVPIPRPAGKLECGFHSNESSKLFKGTYKWDITTQNTVLSGFYYGYSVFQIPAGLLCDRFGGKNMMLYSIVITSILTVLTPLCASISVNALLILRVLMGAFEAPVFGATLVLFSNWYCRFETTFCIGIAMSGSYLGTVFSELISGYFADLSLLGGWPLSFYFIGFLAVPWSILWCIFVSDHPSQCSYISNFEFNLIQSSTNCQNVTKKRANWKKIASTFPLWGCVLGSCSLSFNMYVILSSYPTYLSNIFGVSLHTNGILSAFPFITFWAGTLGFSYITDLLRRNVMATSPARITLFAFGTLGSCVCNGIVHFMGCHLVAVEFLICMSMFFCSAMQQIAPNMVELFPNGVGIAYGIMNTFANSMGILSPYIVNFFTHGNVHSRSQWQKVFYFDNALMLVFGVLYIYLLDTKPQKIL